MDIAFLLGTKIIELTLIVLIGYGLVKSKLLKSEDSKTLSVIGLYVISPAVMIEAFQIDYTPEILQGLQLSLLMAVFLQVILIIIGCLLKRLLNLDPIEHATSIYSNSGNLIIPIVMSLFGKEWVIYASCFIGFSNKITKYYQWYTLFDWLIYWSECYASCGYADCGNSFTEHLIIQTHLFSHTFALVTYSDCIIGINKVDWVCTLG